MSSDDPVLLDTHAILWWKAASDRLSAEAARRIDTSSRVLISPISCWEIAMLLAKDRIALDRPVQVWISDVLGADGVELATLTPAIAVSAGGLTALHGDPADRILVATAAAARCALVTKDRLIHDYARTTGAVEVTW